MLSEGDAPSTLVGGFVGGKLGKLQAGAVGVTVAGGGEAVAEEAIAAANLLRANPQKIRYSQATASPFFRDGKRVDQTVAELVKDPASVNSIPTIHVVLYKGKLYSLDNKRLAAFKTAGLTDVSVIQVDLADPVIAKEFRKKFAPILDGKMIVIVIRQPAGNRLPGFGLDHEAPLGERS